MEEDRAIMKLEQYVEALDGKTRELFDKIFEITTDTSMLDIPVSFYEKVHKYLGRKNETPEQTCRRVRLQTIVRTFNRYTHEGASFNELRTSKPGAETAEKEKIAAEVASLAEKSRASSDFAAPYLHTSDDFVGAIENAGCIKRANLVGYDANNALIIFREPNPLNFKEQDMVDAFAIAKEWWASMHSAKSSLVYPFLGWNCMKRAGASQDWPHMHVLITGKMPYAEVENQRQAMFEYNKGGRNYFEDLFFLHSALGLGIERKASKIMAYLTPAKDKEVMIVSKDLESLARNVHETLEGMREELGVYAFNLGLHLPPINGTRVSKEWCDFPYIARIVDRGNPFASGTDMAIMELYGSKVIGSDNYKVIRALQKNIKKRDEAVSTGDYDPCGQCAEKLMGVGGEPCLGCPHKS